MYVRSVVIRTSIDKPSNQRICIIRVQSRFKDVQLDIRNELCIVPTT